MKTRLIGFWDALRASYWFVPTLMSVGAFVLSAAALRLDHHLSWRGAEKLDWLWAGGADGARTILSTIASSMITVAGVVFSITIVALTLASSQFGPRLLRNFLRDTINQVVLGTFVATYLYCLLVLREVRSVVGQAEFVPYFSVTVSVVLTAASLGMLIFFIHHVALSIQAENMVANVAAELRGSITALFPDEIGEERPITIDTDEIEKRFRDEETRGVTADRGGYLQGIEIESLIALAKSDDVVVKLLLRPGEFVIAGGKLADILPADRVSDDALARVASAHIIERIRTPRQDAEYCVNQLVEIAVRALSPGINDPFTAIACVSWLGDAIGLAATREMPGAGRLDDKDVVRVVAKVTTFSGLTDAAFNAIRQYGASSPAVALCLLEMFASLAPRLRRDEDREVLRRHVDAVAVDARAASPNEGDAAEIDERVRRARAALERAR